jgi:CheY-like chemotaxis protein
MHGPTLPRILIAEDDPDDRLLLSEAFAERFGDCHVTFVENGEELLTGLTAGVHDRPDLIILDLNMPLKDGRATLSELKADPVFSPIPAIIFTTSMAEEDIAQCYASGANSYIIKPSLYSELLQVVGTLRTYWKETVKLPARPVSHEY